MAVLSFIPAPVRNGWLFTAKAQNKFREWLEEEKYGTIAALNAEWGTTYDKFEDVVVPKPIRDNTNAVDDRPEWADLMIWKIEYMDNFINQYYDYHAFCF